MKIYTNMQKFLNEYYRLNNLVSILSHPTPEVSSTTLSFGVESGKRKSIEIPMDLQERWLEDAKRLLVAFEALTYEEWLEREDLDDIK